MLINNKIPSTLFLSEQVYLRFWVVVLHTVSEASVGSYVSNFNKKEKKQFNKYGGFTRIFKIEDYEGTVFKWPLLKMAENH